MVSRQQLLFKILKADSHLLIQDNQVIKQVRGLIDISVPIPSHSLQDCLNGLLPQSKAYPTIPKSAEPSATTSGMSSSLR